jgi:hypothetical protein
MHRIWILFIIPLLFFKMVLAQQSAVAQPPSFGPGQGPIVAIDEAHKNTHTYGSREFQGLVKLLQNDGYRVKAFAQTITKESLKDVRCFMVANPGGWDSPNDSLNDAEIAALLEWIRGGGSLLLVVGHRPFPMNAAKVISALGINNWHNGYAMVDLGIPRPVGNIIFWRSDSLPNAAPTIGATGPGGGTGYQGADAVLAKHRITDGRVPAERISRVTTFGGSAFKVPRGWEKLLTLPKQAASYTPPLTPNAIPSITRDTPRIPAGGWVQGAVKKIGKGRVAVFGGTGLFWAGPAPDNRQFLLNLMSWLSGGL